MKIKNIQKYPVTGDVVYCKTNSPCFEFSSICSDHGINRYYYIGNIQDTGTHVVENTDNDYLLTRNLLSLDEIESKYVDNEFILSKQVRTDLLKKQGFISDPDLIKKGQPVFVKSKFKDTSWKIRICKYTCSDYVVCTDDERYDWYLSYFNNKDNPNLKDIPMSIDVFVPLDNITNINGYYTFNECILVDILRDTCSAVVRCEQKFKNSDILVHQNNCYILSTKSRGTLIKLNVPDWYKGKNSTTYKREGN